MLSRRYKKPFWFTLWLVVIIILVGGGGSLAYLVRYSATDERVCGLCHPVILELWRDSNGHPAEEASCHACHSRVHEIMPREWNIVRHARDQFVPPEYKADDELTNQRCFDCHQDVFDFGYSFKKKIIKFNHRFHMGENLDCVDCHRTSGHEYMTNGTNRPTISECLECHRKELEGPPENRKCLNCHDVMLVPGKNW